MRAFILASLTCLTCVLVASCMAPSAVSPQALALENQCVQSLQSGDYDGAATRCELCLEYDEYVPECINGLGLVAFAKGNNDLARAHFSKAIQISPTFGQARNNLGALHFKLGEYDDALPLFLAAIQIDPGYQDARYNTGLCYLRLGQRQAASKNFSSAKENYALAQNHYQKLVVLNPENSIGYRDLGLIATYLATLDSGESASVELDKAKAYFDQCLAVNKEDPVCIDGLAALSDRKIRNAQSGH